MRLAVRLLTLASDRSPCLLHSVSRKFVQSQLQRWSALSNSGVSFSRNSKAEWTSSVKSYKGSETSTGVLGPLLLPQPTRQSCKAILLDAGACCRSCLPPTPRTGPEKEGASVFPSGNLACWRGQPACCREPGHIWQDAHRAPMLSHTCCLLNTSTDCPTRV